MKVLLLSRYGDMGASSRLRLFQYLPYLRAAGITVDVDPLFSNAYLRKYYASGRKPLGLALAAYWQRRQSLKGLMGYDLVWIEKELFPWLPARFERPKALQRVPYIVDYDDAIHHNYDQLPAGIRHRLLTGKLNDLVTHASLVVVGNNYLGNWARDSGATRVRTLPTVVDLSRYSNNRDVSKSPEFRVGWIGSPATVKYLAIVQAPLVRLARLMPVRLVLVGAGRDLTETFGLPTETHQWDESTEANLLATLHAGIMPLPDSPWERGKCGYKLIQYMASGLPVVSSDVGVNAEIVEHGVNGFLARTSSDWESGLSTLANDRALAIALGSAGRRKVEERYCLQVTGPALVGLLQQAVNLKAD